jgi:hypothetical protein
MVSLKNTIFNPQKITHPTLLRWLQLMTLGKSPSGHQEGSVLANHLQQILNQEH